MKPCDVKAWRIKKGLAQYELAEMLNCSNQLINRWEQELVKSFSVKSANAWEALGEVCDAPKTKKYSVGKPVKKVPRKSLETLSKISSRIIDINGSLYLKESGES